MISLKLIKGHLISAVALALYNHLAQDNEVLAVEPNEEMVASRPKTISTATGREVWTSWQVLKMPV